MTVWTLHVVCCILLLELGDVFCFDVETAGDTTNTVQPHSAKNITVETGVIGEFDISDFSQMIDPDKCLRKITAAEYVVVTESNQKTSMELTEHRVNFVTSQSSTGHTRGTSDIDETVYSSMIPWYCKERTLFTKQYVFPPEIHIVKVSDKTSFYHVNFDECSTVEWMDITGDNGTLILDILQPKPLSDRDCSLCFTLPEGKTVSVWIQYSRFVYVNVRNTEDCITNRRTEHSVQSYILNHIRYFSQGKFLQYTFPYTYSVQFCLQIESNRKKQVTLTIQEFSAAGTITSPMYDKISIIPRRFVKHNASFIVQPGYVVMISVQHFDLAGAHSNDLCLQVKRLEYNKTHTSVLASICVADGTNIKIINTSGIIEFSPALGVHKSKGLKLFYSFHKEEAQPVRLHNGLFNCSTTFYQTFKQHLECNYITECENGEDEQDCFYSTASCRQGISFRHTCYSYFSFLRKMSWMEANGHCQSKDSRLATFLNSSDLYTFADVLMLKLFPSRTWIGLQVSELRFGTMYKHILRWTNNRSSFDFLTRSITSTFPSCALMEMGISGVQIKLNTTYCNSPVTSHVLCEKTTGQFSLAENTVLFHVVQFQFENWSHANIHLVECLEGHFVLDFLSYNSPCLSSVWGNSPTCVTPSGGVMPMFLCDHSRETLPFTLVCDHRLDCSDNSDESFCHHKECTGFVCNNRKCISRDLRCNRLDDCNDGSDERDCYESSIVFSDLLIKVPALSLIELDGSGNFNFTPWNDTRSCPETHFKCPDSYCLPVYLLCNDVTDCPGGADEEGCEGLKIWPGLYRCYNSKVYLHPKHLCDNVAQCPEHDDENYCDLKCPIQCRCQGLAYVCSQPLIARDYPDLRYLDVSGTNMTLRQLRSNYYLVSLRLSGCGLTNLEPMSFQNLRELDLSNNSLHVLELNIFMNLSNLRVFYMSWNPVSMILSASPEIVLMSLGTIHLSGLKLHDFRSSQVLSGFPNIEIVNISHSQIETIGSFQNESRLQVLDLSESPVNTFPADVFKGLKRLKKVYTMNYKLCCPAVLPLSFPQGNCFAPIDEISSCDSLLRLPVFRVFLWIFAAVAIVGNGVSFIVRQFVHKKAAKTGFPVFVTNLCVADFLMGLYLATIGVADYIYQGSYLWHDEMWKNSWMCRVAGFLSLLSSEVSAFIICLITLDRFIVMRFPFTQTRFQRQSASIASGMAWFMGVIIAALPLTPLAAHWDFYGQTGICIPLPFTRHTFSGQKYSYSVMIVLNFVLFMMIAVGQIAIFSSVRSSGKAAANLRGKSSDLVVARRLAFIVLTDFLCWFPIGLLGLLASQSYPIPDEVSVGMAIFVVPINSALNPFLYTFNILMERQREKQKKKLMEYLEKRIRSEVQAEGKKQQPYTIISPHVALMSQILDKARKGQLTYKETDLIVEMAKGFVSEIKPQIQ